MGLAGKLNAFTIVLSKVTTRLQFPRMCDCFSRWLPLGYNNVMSTPTQLLPASASATENAMETITIRPASFNDIADIARIYNEAVLTTTATYDLEPQPIEARVKWFHDHEATGMPMFVAEEDGVIVGWSSLSIFRGKEGYRFTVENSIYISESHRGRGLGRRMLAGLIDSARDLGLHSIVAGIDADTEASIRLHASFGFEKVAHLKQVGYKFNRWLDVVFMQLILK